MSFIEIIKSNWDNPSSGYRPAPFWSWNAELEPERLCRQVDSMHKAGMGGFFMHSRYGLKTEYLGDEWFKCVSACIDRAEDIGMKAYLYDEDRWPSGFAGGTITRRRPELRSCFIAAVDIVGSAEKKSQIVNPLCVFEVKLNDAGKLLSYEQIGIDDDVAAGSMKMCFDVRYQKPEPVFNNSEYISTIDPEAVDEFIKSSYDPYAARYKDKFGGVVPAMFTDEPNYGFWTLQFEDGRHKFVWGRNFVEEFKKRCGYDILPVLVEILFSSEEDGFSKVRYDYHKTLTELFVENFSGKIGKWCDENGIALTGHVLHEATVSDQLVAVGDCMEHYEHMQWPGIDLLMDRHSEFLTVKQCSSVAEQLGKEKVLTELYGCTGWDWPLEGHKFIAGWQFALGINFLCPHLSHYSLSGGAKRDYPSSISDHSGWWKYYGVVNDYLSRISMMLCQGKAVRDIAIIHPIETGWGLFESSMYQEQLKSELDVDRVNNKIAKMLLDEHYGWNFANEALLEKYGSVERDKFIVGKMKYKAVIVPDLLTLRENTVKLLKEFAQAGGIVIFVNNLPSRIAAEKKDSVSELLDLDNVVCVGEDEVIAKLDTLVERRISISAGGVEADFVWDMTKALDGGYLSFMQSLDREKSNVVKVKMTDVDGPVVLWDALTGTKHRVEYAEVDGGVEFELQLEPSGSAMLTYGIECDDAADTEKLTELIKRVPVEGPLDIELTEMNSMPLDFCWYKLGDDGFSELVPVIGADKQIRAKYGLNPRLGLEEQPWYLYQTGAFDLSVRDKGVMRFTFDAEIVPPVCYLVIEQPADFAITVNGKVVSEVCGWWVDEDIKRIDITDVVVSGENTVELGFDYRANMEIEDIYLIGDFGVSKIDESREFAYDNRKLVALPGKLEYGNWVDQGMAFYTGSVEYKIQVEKNGDQRVCIVLPAVECSAVALKVNGDEYVLPWGIMAKDITPSLQQGTNVVTVEVFGSRKNTLGPLHVPKEDWTGPHQFSPDHPKWQDEYILTKYGMIDPVMIEYRQ